MQTRAAGGRGFPIPRFRPEDFSIAPDFPARFDAHCHLFESLKDACAGSEEEHLDVVLSAARRHWRDGYRVAAMPLIFAPRI